MGLSILHYELNGESHWGVLRNQEIIPVQGHYPTLQSFLLEGTRFAREAQATTAQRISLESVKVLSPVTEPARIVCQGANYGAHRAEAGMKPERPAFNLFFRKADSSLSGAGEPIKRPAHVRLLDYEIELGLVIGRTIDKPLKITEANLHDYVAGLVIANDISARDVQLVEGQWYKGKSYRSFGPAGPVLYLLDQDEIPGIYNLDLNLWVNDELRQSSNTRQLLFKPEETLTELSELMNLSVGDLILTGTPGGVALHLSQEDLQQLSNPSVPSEKKMELLMQSQQQNSKYLADGDVVRCEIKSPDGHMDLGVLENKVEAAS